MDFSPAIRQQLINDIKMVLSGFVVHKKLLYIVIAAMVPMVHDPERTVRDDAEEELVRLRKLSPTIVVFIRNAATKEPYANTFTAQTEEIFGEALISNIHGFTEALKDSKVYMRKNAFTELATIATFIQSRIDHLFSHMNFGQYPR